MAEILTESFCERCGTRYTFETVQPKRRSLGALGTLGRGLRNFVVMPDSSFDEALAAARSEAEQQVTSAQLEAFHRTFNFCLSCRQYTCADCWNAVEGRCQTCAPLPAPEVVEAVAAPVEQAPPFVGEASSGADAGALAAVLETPVEAPPAEPEPEAEPVVAEVEPEPEPEAEAEPVDAEVEPEPEPEAEAEPVVAEVEPEPEAEREPAPASEAPVGSAGPREPVAFPGFRPGRSLDDEIAAYELRVAALAAAPPEPLPPVVVAATPPTDVARAELPRETRAFALPPEPTPISAPSSTGTCRSCGLSLSASARFCRRCGTRQVA
jgi:hypothetical protein